MATVTPRKYTQAESRQHVLHPLESLRGYIRTYVSLEGLAVLLLYLALWFWIGLALDYGFFKLFTVDWVQELNGLGTTGHVVRVVLLSVLLAGLLAMVVVKVVLRLVREFRDSSLALVLERRFPKVLGDRLITAVEMADPKLASKYGYSQQMIDHTILDAAERVDQLPVQEVFNWKRLTNYGWLVLGLTVGLYVLVAIGYCLVNWTGAVGGYVHQFNDVAAIWFERNILLSNSIWPRKAHLELVDFPASGELYVGRNVASTPLKVRALKWVIADPRAPEGWRALTLGDLAALPNINPVEGWPRGADEQTRLTPIDELDRTFNNDETRQALDADSRMALEKLLEDLDQLADEPKMSRRLRKLQIPETVMVYFKGANTRSEMTLQKADNNEFSGVYSDLKESVRFTVRGEDYYTPSKRIEVVSPPTLVRLMRNEYEPAYIYYRTPLGGTLADLKGKKQQIRNVPFSLSGDASSVKVPAGSDIELTAEADKPLKDIIRMVPREGKEGEGRAQHPALAKAKVTLDGNRTTFRTRFDDVRGRIDFDFEFTDTFNVSGRRHVVIEAVEDDIPKVEVEVEVIRKTNQGYMITPVAKVPFKGNVSDDRGLDRIEYAYTLTRLESQASQRLRLGMVAGAVQFAPDGFNPNLLAPWYLGVVGRLIDRAAADEDKEPLFAPMTTFEQVLARKRVNPSDNRTVDELKESLTKQPTDRYRPIKQHDILPDVEVFDLTRIVPQLKPIDKEIQPHFQLRIWVAATDNNVEHPRGPRTGTSKERFTFIVVSEAELLQEIFKEEENLHVKLEDTVNRLKDGKLKLEELALQLTKGANAEQMQGAMAVRAQEILDTILKGEDITREVHFDYSRILKELIYNRVQANDKIGQVRDNIVNPLELALSGPFGSTTEAQKAFYDALKAGKPDMKTTEAANRQLDNLIEQLQKVLEHMADVTTFQRVLIELQAIERKQREMSLALNQIRDELERIILDTLK